MYLIEWIDSRGTQRQRLDRTDLTRASRTVTSRPRQRRIGESLVQTRKSTDIRRHCREVEQIVACCRDITGSVTSHESRSCRRGARRCASCRGDGDHPGVSARLGTVACAFHRTVRIRSKLATARRRIDRIPAIAL
jgi:hypothetical protein